MAETQIIARRRRWAPEEKAALLAEVAAAGGRMSVVARRHGISVSLLYNWRSTRRAALALRGSEPVEFVPIGRLGGGPDVATPDEARLLGRSRGDRGGLIEIELGNGVRVRVDALVNEQALSRVLRAARGAA